MGKEKMPVTAAIRSLKDNGVEFIPREYKYEDKGGTARASRELGVPEHQVVKTLIMEDDRHNPLVILMHGDQSVSTKTLARALDVKSVAPCDPATAQRHTGYMVGGTSPFGIRKSMPIYVESTILELPRIFINGGKRGFLVELSPQDLIRVLGAKPVHVAI